MPIDITELDDDGIPAVVALESLTHIDYPDTPATRQPWRTDADLREMREKGTRFFGAVRGGELVGITGITPREEYAETEFTSVHPGYRRCGIALAVKAASIVALASEGVRTFGTGGAQINSGSIGMNQALGYVVDERWVSLVEPAVATEPPLV